MKPAQVPSIVALAAAVAWGCVLALNAPGHLSFDSVVQLGEGRSQSYQSMHPPLMSALMGLGDRLMQGTGLYLVFASGLFFVTLVMLAKRARHPIIPAAVIAVASFSPLILVYQGIVWKDVLFANMAVFAFALLHEANERTLSQRRARFGLYLAALAMAGLSALVRQNGILVPLCMAAAIAGLEMRPQNVSRRLGRFIGVFAVSMAVAMASGGLASNVLRMTAVSPPADATHLGLETLFGYDVVAIAATAGQSAYPAFTARGIDPVAFESHAKEVYTPERLDYIAGSAAMGADLSHLRGQGMGGIWRDLVTQNPSAYLAHRFSVLRELLLPTNPSKCLPIHVGVGGPEALMKELDITPGLRPTDKALYVYSTHFFGTGLMTPLTYLGLAVVLLAGLAVRPRRAHIPVAAMLASAIAFALSFVAIGIACDFRYVYYLVTADVAALVYLSALGWRRARQAA